MKTIMETVILMGATAAAVAVCLVGFFGLLVWLAGGRGPRNHLHRE